MSTPRRTRWVMAALLGVVSAQAAFAAQISFTGEAAADRSVAETFVPGPLEEGGAVGTSLLDLGVDFSYGRTEGYYSDIDPNSPDSDSFYAFCGVNASGDCDLRTGIDGRIVLTGTSIGGVTSFLELEAGFFDEGTNPLLQVFGRDGNLLDSVSGVRGTSPTGQQQYAPLLFTVLRQGADIAFFDFGLSDGEDFQGFGVNRLTLETPTAVPVPGTLGLMGLGLLAVGAIRRRTKA